MVKLDNIRTSIRTDFSEILNRYATLLEKASYQTEVLDSDTIKKEVESMIEAIVQLGVDRLPYDSITTKVLEINEKVDNEELSESFDYLMDAITTALKDIIDDFIDNDTFTGKTMTECSKQDIYSTSIIAFYKLLEHTKLAGIQYQTLYRRTKKEVSDLHNNLNNISDMANKTSKKLNKINKKLNEVKDVKTSIYTDFITILGIFSSFVFVMFGGFSALSDIIQSVSYTTVSLPKTLLISSSLFGFLITVLYSLLYWISIIVDKPFFKYECDCRKPCWNIIHQFAKHRYYLIVMLACILIFLISLILALLNIH